MKITTIITLILLTSSINAHAEKTLESPYQNNNLIKKSSLSSEQTPFNGTYSVQESQAIDKEISKTSTIQETLHTSLVTLKNFATGFVKNSESTSVRLFFVFLLGILMSLTPCIYPMIPVTMGILQASAQKSLFYNFTLALSYSFGIATTFATLGLLAATGSTHFGALLINPFFVTFLIIFLAYLAFSMLGFYEMHTPRFLQGNGTPTANGSFISAFFFGAISGTVASPCLSPGLLLLLSIVATLGNTFLGFIYLFIFGFGLSVPLIIIGTFSNSVNILPSAGLWMVEVKKFFGFMLLGMCFYYANNILPCYSILWLISISLIASGIWYLATIEKFYSSSMKRFKQIVGILLILAGITTAVQAYKATITPTACASSESWHTKLVYQDALEQARIDRKLLLIDFGASWCSSCNTIDKKIIQQSIVHQQLNSKIILIKIDCTDPHEEYCAQLQKQYFIVGFPALILVDPTTETVRAQWGGDLLDLTPEEFVNLVLGQL